MCLNHCASCSDAARLVSSTALSSDCEPMFCLETAIKLMYWSFLVRAGTRSRDTPSPARTGLWGSRWAGFRGLAGAPQAPHTRRGCHTHAPSPPCPAASMLGRQFYPPTSPHSAHPPVQVYDYDEVAPGKSPFSVDTALSLYDLVGDGGWEGADQWRLHAGM